MACPTGRESRENFGHFPSPARGKTCTTAAAVAAGLLPGRPEQTLPAGNMRHRVRLAKRSTNQQLSDVAEKPHGHPGSNMWGSVPGTDRVRKGMAGRWL